MEEIVQIFCRNSYSNEAISALLIKYLHVTDNIDWVSVGRGMFLEPMQTRESFPYYIYRRHSQYSIIYSNWIKKDKSALKKLKELVKNNQPSIAKRVPPVAGSKGSKKNLGF